MPEDEKADATVAATRAWTWEELTQLAIHYGPRCGETIATANGQRVIGVSVRRCKDRVLIDMRLEASEKASGGDGSL